MKLLKGERADPERLVAMWKENGVPVAPLVPQSMPAVEVRPIRALPSQAEMQGKRIEELERQLAMERMRVRELMEREKVALEQAHAQARAGARAVQVASEGERVVDERLLERLEQMGIRRLDSRATVTVLVGELDRLGDEVVALKEEKGRLQAQLVTKAAEVEKERESKEAALSREAEARALLEKMKGSGAIEYAAPPVRDELHEVRLRESGERRIAELQRTIAQQQGAHALQMRGLTGEVARERELRIMAEAREAEAREALREVLQQIVPPVSKVETLDVEGEGRWP